MLYTNGDLATWWRFPFFGVPSALLMAAVLLRPSLQHDTPPPGIVIRFFVALGDSSYALYLTHVFTLRITSLVFGRVFPSLPAVVDYFLLFVTSVAVGHLFYLFFERPVYKALKARLLRRKPTEASA
jgi:peptidoglycan/LPS O-acetylase OafA/YrhL